jgi:ADP-ribose pyrophosphatase YjhB (NUDIX family)
MAYVKAIPRKECSVVSDKVCDHTSVGMLVRRGGSLLLIERRKPPFGFAPPAGHVDGDATYEIAAARELTEEVGLQAQSLILLLEKVKDNPCRRVGGIWHYWKIYEAKTQDTPVVRSEDETLQAGWYTAGQIKKLAERTEQYLAGQVSDEAWEQDPGLEKVWYEYFIELSIIAGQEEPL